MTNAVIRTGQFVDLPHGIRLHVASCGDPAAPLLLFLHGFPEYWGAWRELLPRFADRWHAVAPDLRGFNLSSMPAEVEAYRAHELVRDVLGLIDHYGQRRAALVAHDWGGAVAWATAIGAPQRVSRLVVLNSPHPVPFARALAHDPEQQAASRYMLALRAPGAEAMLAADDHARLLGFFRGMQRAERPWMNDERSAKYRAVWARGLTGGLNYYRASPLYPPGPGDPGTAGVTLDPAAFRVEVPTLVLWGMADKALRPMLLDGLDALVPDLRVERLEHATHWLVHEEPQLVAEAIRAFLSGA